MSELGDVLDDIILARPGVAEAAWSNFRRWGAERGALLLRLISDVFDGPYCEPGKVAGATSACLLLMAAKPSQVQYEEVYNCAEQVELQLTETAPPPSDTIYDTRLHMFLRSPWPVFRLLDALVRLHPSDGDKAREYLAPCRPHEDIFGQPLDFDWEWFRGALLSALDSLSADAQPFALDFRDGSLSEQYRARWARVYQAPSLRDAGAFGSDAFYKFRRKQWEAGCHPGIVSSYLLQVVTFCIRDTDAWLHRYVGSAWRLTNLLTPLTGLMYSDWPVFRVLHMGSLLRRAEGLHPPPQIVELSDGIAEPVRHHSAKILHQLVREALRPAGQQAVPPVVYFSAAWGRFARFLSRVLARWSAMRLPLLLMLVQDREAMQICEGHDASRHGAVACIEVPRRPRLEAFVAKYLALASAAQSGAISVWLDLDVYLPADPTPKVEEALADPAVPHFVLASFFTSRSLSPALLAARAGPETALMLLRYASWLHENPYILDHQGWDEYVQNYDGDFSGSWDYKGRGHSVKPNDGLQLSFALKKGNSTLERPRYVSLGPAVASGDGWAGALTDLIAFHFWGTKEGQEQLFEAFYPFEEAGFSDVAETLLLSYWREPYATDRPSVAGRSQPLYLCAISYAHGCCEKSILRNQESAVSVGVDEARAYGFGDLDKAWVSANSQVLSQRKGAGWWLWKPRLVLQTLEDESVPWHTGVVLWLDAGNFYVGDPRPVVEQALRHSDVVGLRLKCCVENDWTQVEALRRLDATGGVVADRPQLGAYFLIFRKTNVTLSFVREWLRLCEDPDIMVGTGIPSQETASFQRHMADQSVFSVLFKKRGFQAISLEEGHKVVQLDRWRE